MDTATKIDQYISSITDWRGELLAELHKVIKQAAPDLTEDFKWGVPVWTGKAMVCAISAFKDHVKINFFRGAFFAAENELINSGLDSKEHRSINFSVDDKLDSEKLSQLIKLAVAYDQKIEKI